MSAPSLKAWAVGFATVLGIIAFVLAVIGVFWAAERVMGPGGSMAVIGGGTFFGLVWIVADIWERGTGDADS